MVHFMMPAYFIYVFTEILSGAIRGTGDAFIPMLITCVGVCVLRIAWIALIVPRWHDTRAVMLKLPDFMGRICSNIYYLLSARQLDAAWY